MVAMAYSEKFLSEGEQIIRSFRPHWRLLVIPVAWVVVAIAAVIVVVTTLPPDDGSWDLIVSAILVVALLPLAVAPAVKWWFTWYVLTNERLITRSGVISRQGIEIPLENINNINFSQSVLERLLRSGDLLIESAGETGQSHFADIPDPEEFQALLYRTREQRLQESQRGPAPAAPAAGDAADRLEQLARLHSQGVLSDEEYEEKRRKLVEEL
jgi:uncharacterized membrane protein YdbT with pleckstrin-like domain